MKSEVRVVKMKGWVITSDATEYLDSQTFWSALNSVTSKVFGVVLAKVTTNSLFGLEEVAWLWGREDEMISGEVPSHMTILNMVMRAISAVVYGIKGRSERRSER